MDGLDVYLRGLAICRPAVSCPLVPQVIDSMWVGRMFILEDRISLIFNRLFLDLRERERQRDRETERDREANRDRQTDR